MDPGRHALEIDVYTHGRLRTTFSPARTQAVAFAASRSVSPLETMKNGGAS
jgi:hypothetical protein